MARYEGLVTIKRGGKYHPPGTIHEMDDLEARGLGPRVVRPVAGAVSAAPPAPASTTSTDAASAGVLPSGDAPPSGPVVAPVDKEEGGASGQGRIAEIKDAIDLLDDDDFVQTGERAGKPKVRPLADVLGYKPTEDEINAAMALRDEVA